MKLPPVVLLTFAAICAVFALGMWFVFLRPAVTLTAQGVITHKLFKPAGQYIQYPSFTNGAFYTPNVIPLAEGYVFVIQIDQLSASAAYTLTTFAAEKFAVGQKVNVEYQERSLPGIWRRIYITSMSR